MAASNKMRVGIVGSGNIGTDLMYKIARSDSMELALMSGIDPGSEGLARAKELGYATSADGIEAMLESDAKVVFDATSARAHVAHAPRLQSAGKISIDLTPAKVGPSIVPCVNMDAYKNLQNINLISCGAQATVPIVYAISRVAPVAYAEIVATVASKSAGPGTRQNIDEFTRTTAKGLVEVAGAEQAKAIVVLNPADPAIIMRNTVYAVPKDGAEVDESALRDSVSEFAAKVQAYVPGYQITVEPFVDGKRIVVAVEVMGAGDYLPKYAGNLDIITSAAVAVAEKLAAH